ncbi:MAG: pyridoxine 5'-phosphate synthase [Vicinamibacterales bacterium]|jgi:pyridoxine 5-phosphate synthase|nr:pyridoxine 5'-phosphate synthase [Vicinamibacterales bacterium]
MKLGLNIDHIATIRQARRAREPEPVTAALMAELAGAEGITVHLRSDRRHIQDRDVELLRQVVATRLNIEMAATEEMVGIACRVKPHQVTLVPERPDEVTTTGGLDVVQHHSAVRGAVAACRAAGIRASIFVDAIPEHVDASRAAGADAIEINTGPYADAPDAQRQAQLARVAAAAERAAAAGLEVLAGHGLNYVNVTPIVRLPQIVELNIGHAIIARAVLVGLDRAVREMVGLLKT